MITVIRIHVARRSICIINILAGCRATIAVDIPAYWTHHCLCLKGHPQLCSTDVA